MKTTFTALAATMLLFAADASAQCGTPPLSGSFTISNTQIVNRYYAGNGNPAAAATSLTVTDVNRGTGALAPGDLVVIIQMQGADISTANSTAYGGNGSAGNGYLTNGALYAGYYEYNIVQSYSAGALTLTYGLANTYHTRAYSAGNGIQRYQVVRVPWYYDLTVTNTGTVTAAPWDGTTGGVVVIETANNLTLNGTITVQGQGFRGGGGKNFPGVGAGSTTTNMDFVFPSAQTVPANSTGGAKGEGIAGTPVFLNDGSAVTGINALEGYDGGAVGRGAPGNGGGGSTDGDPTTNGFNSGGGGGANGGAGGMGGSGWYGTPNAGTVASFPTGGRGGAAFAQSSLSRFVMGGGGGAGSCNNSNSLSEYQTSGAAGGGIILVRAASFGGTGSVNANGNTATDVVAIPAGGTSTDAGGGGGAGGTIVMVTNKAGVAGLGGITASAAGGRGGNMTTFYDHGTGGGGGGGVIRTNGSFASTNVAGGLNGQTHIAPTTSGTALGNDYGGVPGMPGFVSTTTGVPYTSNAIVVTSPCGPLPIKLLRFSASPQNGRTALSWAVAEGSTAAFFDAERSGDGKSFSTMGTVQAKAGRLTYDFMDEHPLMPRSYYRLRMHEQSGAVLYSQVVVVNGGEAVAPLSVQAIGDGGAIRLSISSDERRSTALTLTDAQGRVVYQSMLELEPGVQTTELPVTGLPAGFYSVRLSSGAVQAVGKIIVR